MKKFLLFLGLFLISLIALGDPPRPNDFNHGGERHDFDHRDGYPDFNHGPFPYQIVNPWQIVAPLVINNISGQRFVLNPVTNQYELRGPGTWTKDSNGNLFYQSAVVWAPTSPNNSGCCPGGNCSTLNVPVTAKVASTSVVTKFVRRAIVRQRFRPVRNLIQRIRNRRSQPAPEPEPEPIPVIPPVPPQPAPNPTPVIVTPDVVTPGIIKNGNLSLMIVVADLTLIDNKLGSIIYSPAVAKLLKSKTNKRFVYDIKTVPKGREALIAKAVKDGIPRILILDGSLPPDKRILASVSVTTEDDLIKLLTTY